MIFNVLLIVASLVGVLVLVSRMFLRFHRYERQWAPAISVDNAVLDMQRKLKEVESEFAAIKEDYQTKRGTYETLLSELAVVDEKLSFAELGVYEPHFDFGDSAKYKAAIRDNRQQQKDMISEKAAVVARTDWRVDGSKSKGKTMSNRAVRLTLRAFNNECDAAIANTRWNNVNAMEKRIERAADQIDNLNASNDVRIQANYLELKLKELYLTHQYREQQKADKEERTEQARSEREEKKLQRAVEKAELEETKFRRQLIEAQARAKLASGSEIEAYQQRINELGRLLERASRETERTKALAEVTRSGFIYIVSNVGSFGKNVVKIGMTRRLNPEDRVRELGDASVPFRFDAHAIVYSHDAPALETALHKRFEANRINRANHRKEFFRVSIGEVRVALSELAPEAVFHSDIEAQEFRETLAMRKHDMAAEQRKQSLSKLPMAI